MKKIISVLTLSLFVFAGCGTSELRKSEELVDSSNTLMSYDIPSDQEEMLSKYDSTVTSVARLRCVELYSEYSKIMKEKVASINAQGGTTGDTLTIGNATIELLADLYDVLYLDDFDAEYVFGQLIIIRDNMDKIGFLK